jgi:NitT/TauT family transport system substrate-binding protein
MRFRITRSRLGLASAAIAAGMALSGVGAASASAAQTLRIMYNPNPTNTSIVVAQQQGFFKKNGLNVQLMTSQATAALMPALGKQFDLLTTTPTSVLQAAAAGLKPELVGGETIENTQYQSSYIVANKGITSVAQLKGQKIGVVSLAGVLYSSMLIRLHRAGLTTSDVTFVQVPFADMNSDLQSGTVQAVVTIYPFQGQMLGEGYSNLGNPVIAVVGSQNAMDAGWVSTQAWAASHAKAIKEFGKAQAQALAWMKANPSGVATILENSFQLPAFVATKYDAVDYTNFSITPNYLLPWAGPLATSGQLKKKLTNKQVKALVYGS